MVVLRAIEGFGEAFYFPAAMALISAYHGKDTRSRAMGIHQSSVYAGTVASGTLGGWLGQHYGWRSSFTLLGVLCGGILADRLARRHRGGRMMTQALGLFCGVPFIFVVGWTLQVPLLIAGMTCFGFCKGLYHSNIWASLHDVVPPERRATAVGVINSVGWLGAGAATVTMAVASRPQNELTQRT